MSSRSYKNANPGNLRYSPFTERRGAVDDGDGYAKFQTSALGFKAMVDLLQAGSYKFLSIKDALYRYAPPADSNPTSAYLEFICEQTKLDPDLILASLSRSELACLCWAMAMFEGWKP